MRRDDGKMDANKEAKVLGIDTAHDDEQAMMQEIARQKTEDRNKTFDTHMNPKTKSQDPTSPTAGGGSNMRM